MYIHVYGHSASGRKLVFKKHQPSMPFKLLWRESKKFLPKARFEPISFGSSWSKEIQLLDLAVSDRVSPLTNYSFSSSCCISPQIYPANKQIAIDPCLVLSKHSSLVLRSQKIPYGSTISMHEATNETALSHQNQPQLSGDSWQI